MGIVLGKISTGSIENVCCMEGEVGSASVRDEGKRERERGRKGGGGNKIEREREREGGRKREKGGSRKGGGGRKREREREIISVTVGDQWKLSFICTNMKSSKG